MATDDCLAEDQSEVELTNFLSYSSQQPICISICLHWIGSSLGPLLYLSLHPEHLTMHSIWQMLNQWLIKWINNIGIRTKIRYHPYSQTHTQRNRNSMCNIPGIKISFLSLLPLSSPAPGRWYQLCTCSIIDRPYIWKIILFKPIDIKPISPIYVNFRVE